MKAAIGSSLVLSIIVTFISIVLLILISSIVYTKAFRIKNRLIDVIEKSEGYTTEAETEITQVLREIGYKVNPYQNNTNCDRYGDSTTLENPTSPYHYCVFKIPSDPDKGGHYYKVVTFAYLDLPLVNLIQVPVYGETKIFYGI